MAGFFARWKNFLNREGSKSNVFLWVHVHEFCINTDR
jgi:hypothetical protein